VCGQCVGVERMDCTVRAMTCRFGACCSSALNCPWWHSVEEIKIFKDEVELQKRKLAVRCGFCARGECRFGADCERAKRVEEIVGTRAKSVAPTDLGRAMRKSEGDEERDVAMVSGGSGSDEAADSDGDFGFRLVGAAAEGIFSFGARRRVGVARRSLAMVDVGGVGGAGAFGALASTEEEVVEEPVDITFLPPKPKEKRKAKEKKKETVVKAAADAAEGAIDSDSGAAETAAVAAAAADGKLRDLEVLSIWSDHIDKTSEETIAEEAAADATEREKQQQMEKQQQRCPLVAAMLSAEEVKAAEAEEAAAVAKQKAAPVAADSNIRQRMVVEMKAIERKNKKVMETVEEKAERLRQSLVQSLW
jgi:chemotaxis protein histidine kinase CheA